MTNSLKYPGAIKQWIALSTLLVLAIIVTFALSALLLQPASKSKLAPVLAKSVEDKDPSSDKKSKQQTPTFSNSKGNDVEDKAKSRQGEPIQLVSSGARVIAPELQPTWAKGDDPMHRVKGIEIDQDPRLKTARQYEGTIVLGAGLYKIRYGRTFIRLQLDNVAHIPFRKQCELKNGKTWPCGGWIRRRVAKLLQFKPIHCNIALNAKISPKVIYPAQCWRNGVDLGHILVREGWATPKDNSSETLNELANEAKRLGKGLWREF